MTARVSRKIELIDPDGLAGVIAPLVAVLPQPAVIEKEPAGNPMTLRMPAAVVNVVPSGFEHPICAVVAVAQPPKTAPVEGENTQRTTAVIVDPGHDRRIGIGNSDNASAAAGRNADPAAGNNLSDTTAAATATGNAKDTESDSQTVAVDAASDRRSADNKRSGAAAAASHVANDASIIS